MQLAPDDVGSLPIECIANLLNREDVNDRDEIAVLRFVLNWIKFDELKRRSVAGNLFSLIRLSTLNKDRIKKCQELASETG